MSSASVGIMRAGLLGLLVSVPTRSHPFMVRRLERLYRIGLLHAHLHDAKTPA